MLTLYGAADLLTAPGCPVCRYAAEASERYMAWFALEGHAQPATIARLCASLGMCASHTRRLMSQPGAAVRLTAVYRYVVTAARDRLAGRAQRQAICPGCEHDQAAAGRALDTLLEDLSDTAVMRKCRDLGGLCLPHLAAAWATARPHLVAPLAETMRNTIAAPARCDWLAGTDADAETRAVLRTAVLSARSPGPAGCWPCLVGAHAEQGALVSLPGLATDAPDPALALCAAHLADAAAAAGAPDIRLLLAWQAKCVTLRRHTRPAGRLLMRPRHNHQGGCAVCSARQTAAERTLASLRGQAHEGAAGVALCVRHHLILGVADPHGARSLAPGAIGRADQLAAELGDAFDRTAWAHSHGTAAPESTAWRRAAAFLDGSVFGGVSWPLSAGRLRE